MTQQAQEFISVPVPREYVTKVYAYLAQLSGTAPSPSESPVDGDAGVEEDGKYPYVEWSVEDLRELTVAQLPSVQAVVGLLDILAEQPGNPVSYTFLVDRLAVERNQLRGSLAAFTRVVHKRHRRRNWPMTWEEGAGENPEYKSEFFYTVSETIAERWKEVRAGQ
ncbi:hypothetical protein [Streptomyces sp. TRM49041]|uniref:hypothetical protein n=1 Tax=Streptomyces sp. TRM49041 TaxID=2603216 RepID=UPI0011EC35F5|nr:hypothetical protein [Streptomyces sp. TRM49041]